MRQLFIVNPAAARVRGRVTEVLEEINTFFRGYGQTEYDIHVTRWARDASGFVRRYVSEASEMVRVHSYGGSGTLFEVINGIIGLPNVQVASYPMGKCNFILRYFGTDKKHLFTSIRNQVLSDVTAIDAIRCGNNYGISDGLIGIEAYAHRYGNEMIEKAKLPPDMCYLSSAVFSTLKASRFRQSYKVALDGQTLDGSYITMMMANGPCYGANLTPAIHAHPNDGILDVYMIEDMSLPRFYSTIPFYIFGHYDKVQSRVLHYRGRKISISSDQIMCMSLDGEAFFDTSAEFEIVPNAIDFVCPHGIDINKLPRIYGRPETVGAAEK